MLVQEVMTFPVLTIKPTALIADAAQMMLDHRISGLPVVDADAGLVGVVSEGDFLRRRELKTEDPAPSWWKEFFMRTGKAAEDYVRAHGRTVADIMSRDPITISQNAKLADAVDLMERRRIKRLPVIEDDKLIGILARSDLMRIIVRTYSVKRQQKVVKDETIRRAVMAEIARQSWSGQGLIHVDVQEGVVNLTGTVYSDSTRAAARVAAETIEGVRSVNEQLDYIEPTTGMIILP